MLRKKYKNMTAVTISLYCAKIRQKLQGFGN